MRIAALDVGSNSFHLIVADVGPAGASRCSTAPRRWSASARRCTHGVIPPEVFRRGLDALRALQPHRRPPQRRRADGGRDQRGARGAERRRVRARGARRGRASTSASSAATRRRASSTWARAARSTSASGGWRCSIVGGGSLEVILADAQELLLHGLAQAGRHPPARRVAMLPIRRRRAKRRAAGRARPRAAGSGRSTRVRAMGFDFVAFTSGTAFALASVAARSDKDTGSAQVDARAQGPAGAREQRLGVDVARGAGAS